MLSPSKNHTMVLFSPQFFVPLNVCSLLTREGDRYEIILFGANRSELINGKLKVDYP